jgi:hypothetical protein
MNKIFLLLGALGLSAMTAAGATLTVTNTSDSGDGSLRDAIKSAAVGDTITFDLPLPATITLTSDELLIDKSLTVEGPGAANLTITIPEGGFNRIIEIAKGLLDVAISGVTISGGDYVEGAGLANGSNGVVRLTSCAVVNNFGYDDGEGRGAGGIYNTGTLTVVESTISGNKANGASGGPPLPEGAGIANYGTLNLINCSVSGNFIFDKGIGGGIVNEQGTMTITNCTIADNNALEGGGGILNYSPGGFPQGIHIKNSIVANNFADSEFGGSDISGGVDSEGYNLIGNDSGANITPTTGDQIGTADAPIDPMLGPLQDNGGPTQTQALLPGSPAIDKGNSEGLTTDQRGRLRPVDDPTIDPAEGGDNSDIGAFEVQAGQPLNISTRLGVGTGDDILDAGFIITGTEAKTVLIRGLGPSLGSETIPDFLPDPALQLNDANGALLTNNNWKDTQETEIEATGLAPSKDVESAILATLPPGSYTAILSGQNGYTGVGLVEVYDLAPAVDSTLGNISTRGFVGVGDNVMIGGFIVGDGDGGPDNVLIRALGPSLPPSEVPDPLADPTLELHDVNGATIATNDNWKDTQEAAIEATQLAPPNDSEAAILEALPAGAYTAIVHGKDDTTGIALVEVYNLDAALAVKKSAAK